MRHLGEHNRDNKKIPLHPSAPFEGHFASTHNGLGGLLYQIKSIQHQDKEDNNQLTSKEAGMR